MAHSTPLGDIVRAHRRTAGWSQERLAEESGLSVGTVRNIEQRGHARLETLSKVAAAFGLTTTELFASGAPLPVGEDSQNRQLLAHFRQALMPPVGIGPEPLTDPGEPEALPVVRRRIEDANQLYYAHRYDSAARMLPGLLRSAEAALVAAGDGEDRQEAVLVRADTLFLAGKYLTQVRQYDLAYQAHTASIRLGRESGNMLTAATGVIGLCWLLLRQDRFDECEHLAATTAEAIEPKLSTASRGQLAAWGELHLRVAAAAIRNNRPDEAKEARRMAATAAAAIGVEHTDHRSHFACFGPVTAELKVVEDLALAGDHRAVLRRADDGLLSQSAMRKIGKPAENDYNRHRLDVAQAHVKLGSTQDAMDELVRIRTTAGEWIKHQPMARYIMEDILRTRKRTLTKEMREMAAYLDAHA